MLTYFNFYPNLIRRNTKNYIPIFVNTLCIQVHDQVEGKFHHRVLKNVMCIFKYMDCILYRCLWNPLDLCCHRISINMNYILNICYILYKWLNNDESYSKLIFFRKGALQHPISTQVKTPWKIQSTGKLS